MLGYRLVCENSVTDIYRILVIYKLPKLHPNYKNLEL